MAFFGIQPSELRVLSERVKWTLMREMNRINARRRLQLIYDVSAASESGETRREYLTNLAMQAFYDDHDSLAKVLEGILRKSS